MVTLETRSRSGVRIDDRRGGHTLTSPAGVQQTGCGTGQCYAFAAGGWYGGPGYNPRALVGLASRAAAPLGARVWPGVGPAPGGLARPAGARAGLTKESIPGWGGWFGTPNGSPCCLSSPWRSPPRARGWCGFRVSGLWRRPSHVLIRFLRWRPASESINGQPTRSSRHRRRSSSQGGPKAVPQRVRVEAPHGPTVG